jgi:triphosphatase
MKGVEIEWQFEAAALPAVDNWLREHAAGFGFALTQAATRDQTDIYLDTDDWRCYRAGYALRLRRVTTAEGIEASFKGLKRPADAEAGPLRRVEISESLADGDLDTLYRAPGEVGERVRILTGAGGLRPIFALQTHRDTLNLHCDGAPAAAVALDETRVLVGPGKEPVRLRRVEVEAAAEPTPELEALVAALGRDCGLVPATLSKYETALAAHDLKPTLAPDLGSTVIDVSVTVGTLAWAVMRRHLAALVAHEAGTRLGEDAEALHDMRVAARRLRAALSLFARYLPARAEHFRNEFKWVATELGVVRDLDVQLERVQAWQAEAAAADHAVFEPLKALLEEQRQRSRKRLLRLLNSRRYQRLIRAYATFLREGPPRRRTHPARVPALEAAPSLIADRYRQARKAGDGLSGSSPPEAYHALRIQSKRLRYAVEFMATLYGEPAQELARNVAALQDVLGLHQDAQVAMAQLRGMSQAYRHRLPPETIFAMGEMAQRYAQQAAECRQQFIQVYAGVRGKSWKKLRQAMGGRQPADAPETPAN